MEFCLSIFHVPMFLISSLQVFQVTQQNPKTAWRVLWAPVGSPVRWACPARSGSPVFREFARPGTAAFTHRWYAKSRAWWRDRSAPPSKPEPGRPGLLEGSTDLRGSADPPAPSSTDTPAHWGFGFEWECVHRVHGSGLLKKSDWCYFITLLRSTNHTKRPKPTTNWSSSQDKTFVFVDLAE